MHKFISITPPEFNTLSSHDLNDIITLDSVRDHILMTRIEKVKKIHSYAVIPPKSGNKDNRWRTSYKDEKGNRKSLKAQTENELYLKLYEIYFSQNIDKKTFHDLFLEWIEYKSNLVNSKNTLIRHKQHYNKYFANTEIDSKSISKLDVIYMEALCNKLIKDRNLTRKEFTNIKTILNGMFDLAFRKHEIKENPMVNVRIMVKFRQVNRKTGETETYNTEELESLIKYLDSKYQETHDSAYLAVKVNFYLGLRVGELTALKWGDITGLNHLHIVREEVRDQETNVTSVVDHTKTSNDRFVALIPKAFSILLSIRPDNYKDDDYIFMRDGKRLTSRKINYVLEKYAQRMDVKAKSSHKIRKTYASNLNVAGVPLDEIRKQLGHTNLSTTMSYIFNPLTEQETYELIKEAL